MRILFVAPYIPSLIRVRPYNLIRALAALGNRVHLVALQPPEDRAASPAELEVTCERVDVFPLSRPRTLWNAASALLTAAPIQAAYSHHPGAERFLRRCAASGDYDVLHVEHLRGAVLAGSVTGIPRVFDSVDSIAHLFEQASRRAPRLTQRLIARLDLGRTRRFEARAPFRFDRTLVTSPADADAIRRLARAAVGERIAVVPNGVDLEYFQPAPRDGDQPIVLFSGKMSYHANVAAALYLAREIMPIVWRHRPDAQLFIVGKDPGAAIQSLGEDARISVTGYVKDIRPHFARAAVAVAPLLYGAGIQNKVLEAMACGVPVVAAPAVCNALSARPDRHLLIGANADQLAQAVLQIISDASLRQRLRAAGRAYVEEHHRWSTIAQQLVAIYQSVGISKPA